MAGIKGTRVEQGASMPASKDQRTGDKGVAGSAEVGATNAKRPVSGGIENQNISSSKAAQPATRKTTNGG